eukprot:scaffold909_cov135-Cylindrotheca_fusiformis.AAC.36
MAVTKLGCFIFVSELVGMTSYDSGSGNCNLSLVDSPSRKSHVSSVPRQHVCEKEAQRENAVEQAYYDTKEQAFQRSFGFLRF